MNKFVNRYIKFSFLFAIIISPLYFIFNNPKALILGMFFGLSIRSLIFKLSAYDLDKTLNMPPDKAKKYASFNYLKRFLIYAITLIVSIKSPLLNIYTCALGLVILSWTIHIINIIDIFKSNKRRDQ